MPIHWGQAIYQLIARILMISQHAQYATLLPQSFLSPWPLIWYPLQQRILCVDIDVVNTRLSLMMMYKSFLLLIKVHFLTMPKIQSLRTFVSLIRNFLYCYLLCNRFSCFTFLASSMPRWLL